MALRAMLTDGAAFCAFLRRGGGIDSALTEVASGRSSVESQTHLPVNVRTFNTIESVALIVLCPGEQRLVPSSVRTKFGRPPRRSDPPRARRGRLRADAAFRSGAAGARVLLLGPARSQPSHGPPSPRG